MNGVEMFETCNDNDICFDSHFLVIVIQIPHHMDSGHPPEAEFLAKIKAIKGVSQVETQTITNVQI